MIVNRLKHRRQLFRRELARQTPLIDGPETEAVAKAIRYSAHQAKAIIAEDVTPFDPRESFPQRLLQALE